MNDQLINELSELCNILPEYWDIFGKKHVLSSDTKIEILKAMNIKIDTDEDINNEIKYRRWYPWKNFVEPVHVFSEKEQPVKVPVYLPITEENETDLKITCSVEDEKGEESEFILTNAAVNIAETQWIEDTRYVKIELPDITERNIGYYDLFIECGHPEAIFPGESKVMQKKTKVIITPDTCYVPDELNKGKAWGLSINLYAIRSSRNWGIGDFTDLTRIVRWVAELHGDSVGINPLHALQNTVPFGISPYSPISRLYKNFIYLDVEKIPEVMDSNIKETISKKSGREIDELRKTDLIDYEKIADLKERILREAFSDFYEKNYAQSTHRGNEFKKYISEEGSALESFALFLTLHRYMRETKGFHAWQQWPEEFRNPSNKAVCEFKKLWEKEILFYQYVQWLIDTQHAEAAAEAERVGMKIGLYHDLAIGSVGSGSEAWNFQDIIAVGADVGAPPDDFNPDGQNWGFPPIIPEKLKETAYELFVQTIRKNMKYGGALRIDHALGLFRLFWIPHGMSPAEGAYINYPHEDLLRIIALESVRNRTMVIAEDLGTIGENVRDTLKRFNMLSYRLFYFERDYPDPSFLSPGKYPDMALCAVTTHDLPTLYGFWGGRDLKVKMELGQNPDMNIWNDRMEERTRDKQLIISALKSADIIDEEYPAEPEKIPDMTHQLCLAVYEYLALTPCKFLLVSLDDIIGTLNQQNMPGTVDSYPNWRQKTPLALAEMISDQRFLSLAEMLRKRLSL